jgi:hypothetical protein
MPADVISRLGVSPMAPELAVRHCSGDFQPPVIPRSQQRRLEATTTKLGPLSASPGRRQILVSEFALIGFHVSRSIPLCRSLCCVTRKN